MDRKSAEALVKAIEECVYGPGGDPIEDTLRPAATMVKVLIEEGFKDLLPEDDYINVLTGSNIEDCNYLEDLGYAKYVEPEED